MDSAEIADLLGLDDTELAELNMADDTGREIEDVDCKAPLPVQWILMAVHEDRMGEAAGPLAELQMLADFCGTTHRLEAEGQCAPRD